MAKKQIEIMDTSFRDGFQSVYGARVFTKDFLPALKSAVDAGIKHFEVGGGARFQSSFFYCQENAFEMMDKIRETVGNDINLQTLARGVNVVGLESQPRDIVNLHAKLFKKHGMTTIRNFDALNDVNNLIYSGECIKNNGLKHEVTITMMGLPFNEDGAHTPEFYEGTLNQIIESGLPFDSIAFKDASGTSTPKTVFETISRARKLLPETHIRFHSHETAGTGLACYLAALEAGVDGIDLAMKPVSGGTSQPDIISMWHALRGSEFELNIDINKIIETEEIFKDCMKDYFLPPEARSVDPIIVFSPMPGGALTANTQMMRDNNILDKYPEVIKAMEEVVAKGGYGTSVTPVSQFYFQQAFNNVMFGPWKKIANGYGKMVLGYFGKTPRTPDSEIVDEAARQLELAPTNLTPLDINDKDSSKGIEAAKKMLLEENLEITDETIFIAATCKEKGILFLKGEAPCGVRKVAKEAVQTSTTDEKTNNYTVNVDGNNYNVTFENGKAFVNGKSYDVSVKEGSAIVQAEKLNEDSLDVSSPLPGSVLRVLVSEGDEVIEGDSLLVIEAMKMETEIKAPTNGSVDSIMVNVGDQIKTGQVLVSIN